MQIYKKKKNYMWILKGVSYEVHVYRLCSFFEGEQDPKLMWEKEKSLLMSMSNFVFPTMSAEFLSCRSCFP